MFVTKKQYKALLELVDNLNARVHGLEWSRDWHSGDSTRRSYEAGSKAQQASFNEARKKA